MTRRPPVRRAWRAARRRDREGRRRRCRLRVPCARGRAAAPPMQSYQIIEDNPTEVDGPPTMTVDEFLRSATACLARVPRDGKRGKTGRH